MVFSRFTRAFLPTTLLALGLATLAHAEEKSLWQKFKDFFSPTPTVEGDGPEYDKLRELDKKINTLEGKYSRERRPNNKANIRKEIDKLKKEREALAEQIKKNPPQSSSAISSASQHAEQPNSSAAATQNSSHNVTQSSTATTCKTDTVFVRDTVVVHDTLYVIVADKAAAAPTSPAEQATDSVQVPADSSQAPQPGTK
jgi:TolA-binding protein